MPNAKVEPNKKDRTKLDKAKEVVKNNWKPFAVGVVLTTVTYAVTRQVNMRYFNPNAVLFKKIVIKDSVLLIQTYARHQGPPSWMVRSGDQLWRSQTAAAKATGVSKATMSQHLNGHRPHINGRVFERVAIEVGRKG